MGTLLGPPVLFPPAMEVRLLGGRIGFEAADGGLTVAGLLAPGAAVDEVGDGPFFVVVEAGPDGGGALNTGGFTGAALPLFSFSPEPKAARTGRAPPAIFAPALAAEASAARILPFSRALIPVAAAAEGFAAGFFALGTGNKTRPFPVVGPLLLFGTTFGTDFFS